MALSNAERQRQFRQRAAKALRNEVQKSREDEHPYIGFRAVPDDEKEGRFRQGTVDSAHRSVGEGKTFFDTFPIFCRDLLKSRAWEHERIFSLGARVPPTSFERFITAPYPKGLGIDIDVFEKLVRAIDDPELTALFEDYLSLNQGKTG